jgi:hypothetical protein
MISAPQLKIAPSMTVIEAARLRERIKHERALEYGPSVKPMQVKPKAMAAKA